MSSICPKCAYLIICDARRKDSIVECEDYKSKVQTNAERIRAMTDEELAEWIAETKITGCPGELTYKETMCDVESCVDCWLDWLKQEVNNDSTT